MIEMSAKAKASKEEAKAYLVAEGGDPLWIDEFLDCFTWDDSDYEFGYDFLAEFKEWLEEK